MSIKIIRTQNQIWSAHTHSRYSANDALPDVQELVARAKQLGHPALGLTDHGNIAGSVQLYKNCMKAGIKPFPGSELYIVGTRNDKKAKRHHMCILAFTTRGYENLVKISTRSHQNFHNKPILDFTDLAELSDAGLLKGIAATSGCYFGHIAQAVVRGDDAEAKALMQTMDSWFDRFYVEQQNHNIEHGDGWNDDQLATALHILAQQSGLPTILTQDSHYVLEGDRPDHEALKRLVAFGPDVDDAVFPGDGFHLADDRWFYDRHDYTRYSDGLAGLTDLLEAHDLAIRELDHYRYSIPVTVADPQQELEFSTRGLVQGYSKNHQDRLEEELNVIRDTGMAGYLLLVAEVTDWCRKNGVLYQARGSASGSMCCFLLGITQVDPLKWNLSFERFISRDRTKPPDIDLDIEHDRRRDLIDWLSNRFAVHQIGTWLELSMRGDEEDEGKGSLRVKYFSRKRQIGEEIKDWAEVPPEDKRMLYRLSDRKMFGGYGAHAAGMILTTNHSEFEKLIPMMWIASSKTMVSQYEMDDVEALGAVKLDVLGLKTLSVIHKCMEFLGRDVFDGLDWIPLTDRATYQALGRGDTDGVFQLEGGSSRRGVRELKPTKIADVIAAMALFRPATMESGATRSYMERRRGEERVPDRHEVIARHTAKTYGIMLFQEQVISILRELGMTPDDLTTFLKAVKASNESIGNAAEVIANYQQLVHNLCTEREMDETDFAWLWHAIEGFAKYGFNLAHSTAYGLTAYRSAYLVVNYPIEYHAALLSVAAGTDKEQKYVAATRGRGIHIYRPCVNKSDVKYTVDRKGVRKGLLSIKGVGIKAAEELVAKRPQGGYESLKQLCTLVDPRKVTGAKAYLAEGDTGVGIINRLVEADALSAIL